MARKNRSEMMKGVDILATAVSVGDEITVKRYGKRGRTQYGSAALPVRASEGRKRKDISRMAELIMLIAQQYADEAPANPKYPHTPRIGGGLLWHGVGGVPRAAYPFRRSDLRQKSSPYRNQFARKIERNSEGSYVVVGNNAPTAAFVEFGSRGGGKGGQKTLRGRFRIEQEFTQLHSVKTRKLAGTSRRRIAPGQIGAKGKTYGGFMAIPLKAQRYNKAIRGRNKPYSQRVLDKNPSVQPEYRQWKRATARRAGRLKRDGVLMSPRESFVDARGVSRTRYVKVPNKPQAARDSEKNRRAREDDATPFRFVGLDKAGRPTLFIRRINLYGPYAILRRAVNDGVSDYLRR